MIEAGDPEAFEGDEVLELETEIEGVDPPELEEEDGPAEIGFSDEGEESEDDTPLVKKLRDQIRKLARQNRTAPAVHNNDPEPTVIQRPTTELEAYDYDQSRLDSAWSEYEASKDAHAEWKVRQAKREAMAEKSAAAQLEALDKQRKALGVSDYEDRAATVKDRLSDQQMAILVSAADNAPQLVYALGRSANRLDILAAEGNLARFAAMVGKLEKDIKVSKRKPPAPESTVRGATASIAVTTGEKELARLEAEAEKTGDRTKVIAYRKQMRQSS